MEIKKVFSQFTMKTKTDIVLYHEKILTFFFSSLFFRDTWNVYFIDYGRTSNNGHLSSTAIFLVVADCPHTHPYFNWPSLFQVFS